MKLKIFKISLLSTLICLSFYSSAEDYFDPAMLDSQLGIDPGQVNLSQFSTNNSIPEGEFVIDIVVNQSHFGDGAVNFISSENGKVVPEITPAMLASWGVNVKSIAKLNELAPDTKITDLSEYIENTMVTTDISNLKMQVSIPQIAMAVKADGYIDPSLLDDGISAVFFNYFISGNRQWIEQDKNNQVNDNIFVGVQSGVNLGVWRVRSNMTHSRSNSEQGSTNDTHFSDTYVMRAIHKISSVLTIGETGSSNDVLDSFPFKGLKLVSDEQMLPSSLRGFAPEINGIAQSNAKVTVRQNGYVVYQTYVSPGAFSLKDISPSGNTGDLDVTVTEEDGTEKTFTIAYSSLPVMLRPGGFKYEINAGRFDGGITEGNKQSDFVSATAIYGLPVDTTLYGGLLAAQKYLSVVGGLGVSLGSFGAFSADITHSSADFEGEEGRKDGQSYRLRYSKSMMTTGTSIDLTALRYSTREYFSFSEFNSQGYKLRDGVAPWLNQRQRSSFTTSLTQSLSDYGSIYLSGSIYDYWGTDREVHQLSLGYTGSYQSVNYSVNYSIDRVKSDEKWPENRQVTVNVSVPFSIFSSNETVRNMNSTYSYSRDNNGRVTQQAGFNGTVLDNRLSYGISQGFANRGQGNSVISGSCRYLKNNLSVLSVRYVSKVNIMKRKSCFYSAVFAGLLCSGISHAQYTEYGQLTLTLSGVVDIVRNPSSWVPHYVPGALTGSTSWRVSPIYSNVQVGSWYPGNPWSQYGSEILMLSNMRDRCNNQSFVVLPESGVSTLPLTNMADQSQQIYMIPALNYRMTFSGDGWNDTVYTGSFGSGSNALYPKTNYCYVPINKPVWYGGTKYLTLTSPGTYPVYVPKAVTAGNYVYSGAKLTIAFGGVTYESISRADLNIITNIKVIRVCQISNVANSNFDVVMGRDNQVLKESSFSFTCSGDGQQMYLSAVAVEGQADSVDPAKLLLNPVSGGTTAPTGRPWVIGKAYVNTSGPAVTCKDTGSSGLIPFNNSDLQLPLKAKVDEMYNMTIKWAICANDQTTPGSYRGRTQVSVFTKL